MGSERLVRFPLHAWGQAKQAFLRTEKTQTLLRGSVGSLIMRACSIGIRMLVSILLARLLGASGYGVYAYAVVLLGFLSIPTTLGLDHVLLRYVSAYKETRSWSALKGLLRFSATLATGAAVSVTLVSLAIIALLPGIEWNLRATMLITLALTPIVVLTSLRQASLRGLDHPVLALVPEGILNPVVLLMVVGGAYFLMGGHLRPPHVALANATGWVVAFAIGTLFLLRKLTEPVRVSTPTYEKTKWMAMVPPLIFIGGAYFVVSRGEVVVLGALGTSRDVGLYTIASRGAELMLFMYDAMTLAGASLFSAIYATGDMKELQRYTSLVTKSILWISLPVYLGFMVIAPWFLGLFGAEFVEGVGALRVLATTYFLSSVGGFVIIMLYMTGHQRDVAIVMGIIAVGNVALSFLLIPRLGVMGAAIASGTSLVLLKGTLVFLLYKRVGIISLPFNYEWKSHKRDLLSGPRGDGI